MMMIMNMTKKMMKKVVILIIKIIKMIIMMNDNDVDNNNSSCGQEGIANSNGCADDNNHDQCSSTYILVHCLDPGGCHGNS